MALFTLRMYHDLKPVMTGWQSFVGAGRIPATNDQPRGY
jgi:hypothetical protein